MGIKAADRQPREAEDRKKTRLLLCATEGNRRFLRRMLWLGGNVQIVVWNYPLKKFAKVVDINTIQSLKRLLSEPPEQVLEKIYRLT